MNMEDQSSLLAGAARHAAEKVVVELVEQVEQSDVGAGRGGRSREMVPCPTATLR